MSDEFNNRFRHAMRILRDMERGLSAEQQGEGAPRHVWRETGPGQYRRYRNPETFSPLEAFSPEGLRGAWEEGSAFWGETLKPVGDAVGGALRRVDSVRANMAERDRRERELRETYMPLIRDANARTDWAMGEADRRERNFSDAVGGLADHTRDMRATVSDRLGPYQNEWSLPPDRMTDEEIMAELSR